MFKSIKKYLFIFIAFLSIIYFANDLRNIFNKNILELHTDNGTNLFITTNWLGFKVGGHNCISIDRLDSRIHSGRVAIKQYSGYNRNERINSIIKVRWLNNDSLVIIYSKLKNNNLKIDSLNWLKNK